jgi:hypothetical protein
MCCIKTADSHLLRLLLSLKQFAQDVEALKMSCNT